jgi:ATP-dependent DNA helicase RecG
MMVVLMSRSGGEVIDEWFYNSGIQAFGNFGMPANLGAEIEANEQNLESLIDGGESETLEFKEKLPPALTLAKTISGFANSGGGYLVIGVNDSGEVVGYEADKLADRLTNIVHDNCDPAPSFTAAPSAVRGMSVFVVTVAEGNDKPYVLKDNGVYIRAGATTRRANRYEMDRLYAGKQPGSRSWQ